MLTATECRNAKPREAPYKLTDANGLHLYVTPTGSRLWRYRYKWAGKEYLLSLGAYPDMSLADAREARDDARKTLKAGVNPSVQKRERKAAGLVQAANTLEKVARAWHEAQTPIWGEKHAGAVLASLEPVFRSIGHLPIAEITPTIVLAELKKIEARSGEVAGRVRQRLSAVFVFAIGHGLCETDPAAIVRTALRPVIRGRQPAITDLGQARELLRRCEDVDGYGLTRLAHRFLVLTNVRPSEVLGAVWSEIEGLDGDLPQWSIPPERMKMKNPHLAPLSRQAVEVLRAAQSLGLRSDYIFPSVRGWKRPMSLGALEALTRRAGYHGKHVPHGWRSTFSTVMNERYPEDRRYIDLMLAHSPPGTVEAAYNRSLYLDRRRELAQIWADLILEGARPALSLLDGPIRTNLSMAAQTAAGLPATAVADNTAQ